MSEILDMPKLIREASEKEGDVWMPIADSWREICTTSSVMSREFEKQQNVLENIALDLQKRGVKHILILGSGDSWFAGMAVCYAFEHYAGITAIPIQAYEYAMYGSLLADENSAVVVISSSGRPTTTWDALDRALQTESYVVGISDTDYEGNPFLEKPHASINPSAKKLGMPAQTTTVTIGLLINLALIMGRESSFLAKDTYDDLVAQLRNIPNQILGLLSSVDEVLADAAKHGALHRIHTIIGSGPNYGVAHVASALLAEGPQFTGHPMPAEEYHHALRGRTIQKGDPVLLVAPSGQGYPRVVEAGSDLKELGAYVMAVIDEGEQLITAIADNSVHVPSVDEPMSPLLTLPPVQMYSLYLASERIAAGYQRPLVN